MATREAARLGIFERIGVHLDEHLSAWLVIPSTIALCFIWPILAPLFDWHSLQREEIVLRIAGGLIVVVTNIIGNILSISKQRKVHELDKETMS